jgi:protein ImuB
MTLTHARAIGSNIRIAPFDPAADRASLCKLAEWASRYSPVIGIDPDSLQHDAEPDGLLLDIRGVAHLFGSEPAFARRICSDLASLGLTARIAIAPTIGAAWALARFARDPISICPPDANLDRTLAPLPVAALRIGPELAASLHALGIEHIADLLALPRSSLPSRFGPLVTRRLDQLRGHAFDLITPIRPEPPLHLFINFTGPTTRTEAVEHATHELLAQLESELTLKDRGVRTLDIEFTRYGPKGKDLATARIHLSRASRNSKHLWTLLRRHIENLHMGFGVEGVALTVLRQGRIRTKQLHTQPADHPPPLHEHSTGELIDILSDRLGADRVLAPVPTQSHDPHRAWTLRSVMKLTDRGSPLPIPPPPRCDRPSVLFDPPEPAEAVALMPDHPPSQLRWRTQTHTIIRGIGPERISREWWHTAPLAHTSCDFHRLQTVDGSWLWVARDLSTSQWAVHGLWG